MTSIIFISTATRSTNVLNAGTFSTHIGLNYHALLLSVGRVVVEIKIIEVMTTSITAKNTTFGRPQHQK
jgi:hypothetical protein